MAEFEWGRTSVEQCPQVNGLLPNPTNGCDGMKEVFEDNVYAGTTRPYGLTAALMGAHTLGSARIETSGFNGAWSDAANQGIFNNDYYYGILAKGWAPELSVNGVEGKNQWKRVDSGADPDHKEMMLDTDMCLAWGTNLELQECIGTYGPNDRRCNTYIGNDVEGVIATQGSCCVWGGAQELYDQGLFV